MSFTCSHILCLHNAKINRVTKPHYIPYTHTHTHRHTCSPHYCSLQHHKTTSYLQRFIECEISIYTRTHPKDHCWKIKRVELRERLFIKKKKVSVFVHSRMMPDATHTRWCSSRGVLCILYEYIF